MNGEIYAPTHGAGIQTPRPSNRIWYPGRPEKPAFHLLIANANLESRSGGLVYRGWLVCGFLGRRQYPDLSSKQTVVRQAAKAPR